MENLRRRQEWDQSYYSQRNIDTLKDDSVWEEPAQTGITTMNRAFQTKLLAH